MAEDKGVPVVRLDCSEVEYYYAELAPREDGGLEGADGARAQAVSEELCCVFKTARP